MRKKHLFPTLLLLTALLTGMIICIGCGGGGGGGSGDSTPPTVNSVSPSDGTTNVEPTSTVKITFSEAMTESTINGTNITVTGPAGAVAGTVTYDSSTKTATFTSTYRLNLQTSHTVGVSTGVKDAAGNAMTSNFSSTFQVREGIWETAGLIESDNAGNAMYPQVAIDSYGNVAAVWQQNDGTRYNIYSNRYSIDSGWGSPELIETDNTSDAAAPYVAFDSSGNAIAVWHQHDGVRNNIWANRYSYGSGWETAELIETDNAGDAMVPRVAFDSSGNAYAVWFQNDGVRYNIWSNRYASGSGWGTAELIESDNAGNAGYPRLAVDPSGNVEVVWFQSDGVRYNIWSNRYTPGSGWGTAGLIETDNAGSSNTPEISVDSSGNFIAVWSQDDGTRYNIWSNRYTSGSGWGTAQLIETDNAGNASNPQISFDSSGNAVAVWHQDDGTWENIWSNRYTSGSGWGTAGLIENDNSGDAYYPQVGVDPSGNAIVVWYQSDGTRDNIWAVRYVSGTGWGSPGLLESDNTGDAQYPQIAVNPSGTGAAVWQQSDGARTNIWADLFQ